MWRRSDSRPKGRWVLADYRDRGVVIERGDNAEEVGKDVVHVGGVKIIYITVSEPNELEHVSCTFALTYFRYDSSCPQTTCRWWDSETQQCMARHLCSCVAGPYSVSRCSDPVRKISNQLSTFTAQIGPFDHVNPEVQLITVKHFFHAAVEIVGAIAPCFCQRTIACQAGDSADCFGIRNHVCIKAGAICLRTVSDQSVIIAAALRRYIQAMSILGRLRVVSDGNITSCLSMFQNRAVHVMRVGDARELFNSASSVLFDQVLDIVRIAMDELCHHPAVTFVCPFQMPLRYTGAVVINVLQAFIWDVNERTHGQGNS
ncbi:hypothetical protein KC360_g138 [Hortaea werneckii]|nr:hypothetical protein KC360_g138 [Hortaea werneckii]